MEALVECFCDFGESIVRHVQDEYGTTDVTICHDLVMSLEQVLEYALFLEQAIPHCNQCQELILCIRQMICVMEENNDQRVRHTVLGRPVLEVEEDRIRFFLDNGFKVKDIASLFGCSKQTIERRMNIYGLLSRNHTAIPDAELDEIVHALCSVFPRSGEKLIDGRLRGQGIHVQRARVRESLRRVDPVGVHMRMKRVLHRRKYQVVSPNALWHIDGYHKLIRWHIVIHGGIDGYSRLVTFLHASANNRAETVLSVFMNAINEFGLPSRIRTDKGGENVLIAQYMLGHPDRGPGRGSIIAGRSTHNQRIEQFWRDLFSGCISFFYYFFYFLEDVGLLDIDNPVDLYSLHYVFLPIIQNQLDLFREAWATHPLRTERNRSPLQLWILGLNEMNIEDQVHNAVTGLSAVSICKKN